MSKTEKGNKVVLQYVPGSNRRNLQTNEETLCVAEH